MQFKWDEFEISYYYPFPVNKVFDAWSNGRGLKKFFIESIKITDIGNSSRIRADDENAKTGDKYAWKWRHGYELEGEFIAVSENKEVALSFGSMKVSVSFSQIGDITLLKLKQTGIPITEEGKIFSHMNCRICWTFFLTNLKSVLMTGTDLRDTDPNRASSFEIPH